MTRQKELQLKVIEWAESKGLLKGITTERVEKQTLKVLEEVGETAGAYLKNKKDELIDGIGDTAVTIIILAKMVNKKLELNTWDVCELSNPLGVAHYITQAWNFDFISSQDNLSLAYSSLAEFSEYLELDFDDCLETAYNVIAKRTGKMVGNTFIKD